jgi:hypothetical protein
MSEINRSYDPSQIHHKMNVTKENSIPTVKPSLEDPLAHIDSLLNEDDALANIAANIGLLTKPSGSLVDIEDEGHVTEQEVDDTLTAAVLDAVLANLLMDEMVGLGVIEGMNQLIQMNHDGKLGDLSRDELDSLIALLQSGVSLDVGMDLLAQGLPVMEVLSLLEDLSLHMPPPELINLIKSGMNTTQLSAVFDLIDVGVPLSIAMEAIASGVSVNDLMAVIASGASLGDLKQAISMFKDGSTLNQVLNKLKGSAQFGQGAAISPNHYVRPQPVKAFSDAKVKEFAEGVIKDIGRHASRDELSVSAGIFEVLTLLAKLSATNRKMAKQDRESHMKLAVQEMRVQADKIVEEGKKQFTMGCISAGLQIATGALSIGMSAFSAQKSMTANAKAHENQTNLNKATGAEDVLGIKDLASGDLLKVKGHENIPKKDIVMINAPGDATGGNSGVMMIKNKPDTYPKHVQEHLDGLKGGFLDSGKTGDFDTMHKNALNRLDPKNKVEDKNFIKDLKKDRIPELKNLKDSAGKPIRLNGDGPINLDQTLEGGDTLRGLLGKSDSGNKALERIENHNNLMQAQDFVNRYPSFTDPRFAKEHAKFAKLTGSQALDLTEKGLDQPVTVGDMRGLLKTQYAAESTKAAHKAQKALDMFTAGQQSMQMASRGIEGFSMGVMQSSIARTNAEKKESESRERIEMAMKDAAEQVMNDAVQQFSKTLDTLAGILSENKETQKSIMRNT